MKQSKGFTLMEMLVVIVILGILSVTAAPKFLNLQRDARIGTLEGAEGAIRGADRIVYGKAAGKGVEKRSLSTISNGKESIYTAYGHIKLTKENLKKAMTLDGYYIHDNSDGDDPRALVITQDKAPNYLKNEKQCHLEVEQEKLTGELSFEYETDGC